MHHCPRIAAPLPGVDYCHAVRAAGGEELLRDCRPSEGVDGLVLTWGMAEGRYSFAAWLEPHAEERIAFDFEVALPPYADGGVALGPFPGGKRARNFKGPSLGRFPLVSADVWTSDQLSEGSRSVDAFSGTRGTLTLKRR